LRADVQAKQLDRSMRHDVRVSGKRPRDAFTEMITTVPKKFKAAGMQEDVIAKLPTFVEVRTQLSRHRAVRCTPVPDPLCLPPELRTTLRGREAAEGNVHKDEPFLRHCGQGGRLLLFCASTELSALHASKYVICDGTFEMSPDTAYQVYTFHGFVTGEGLPLAWALLPNKSQSTYVEVLTALRDGMLAAFGDVGCKKTFVTDFEQAAINAINVVFPEATVKGCSFHFREAVLHRVQHEGLRPMYDDKGSPIHRWLRKLMAMTGLPTFAVPLAWNWLKYPPASGDPATDAKTQAVSAYFERTWIDGEIKSALWSRYDNVGPRTTNLAESKK